MKNKIGKKNLNQAELKKLIREEEKRRLLFYTEAEIAGHGTSYRVEREGERFTLRGGRDISIREISDVVSQRLRDYYVMFVQPYYDEMFRLNKWKQEGNYKPSIMAVWTNEIIYKRFNRDVLPTLQTLNPYTELGIRHYKHFQFLNERGLIMLAGFINDAVTMMRTCDTWYEFRMKYGKKFGLPVQLRMWENEG
jgi:hypothetical protein